MCCNHGPGSERRSRVNKHHRTTGVRERVCFRFEKYTRAVLFPSQVNLIIAIALSLRLFILVICIRRKVHQVSVNNTLETNNSSIYLDFLKVEVKYTQK